MSLSTFDIHADLLALDGTGEVASPRMSASTASYSESDAT